ncbi:MULTISPECIES: DAHL domain-containing protein [Pseudomonas]|uniref:DAHL domain-containing protein n=1 Tax=Pseudomonas TaxID=286 RepID=UPI00215F9D3A|nr:MULTISPECIES: DAHL domain-containing protein [Pseudomonas]MDF9756693.1 C4-dicarboxylate-specific signal transduction histidine kinase [Pseudomonas hunanensis]UVL17071.1 histidine kinase [Pseudomonas sp. B21-044]UVM14420.1 histidine kinase [Pseudomonas sp. B21-023]
MKTITRRGSLLLLSGVVLTLSATLGFLYLNSGSELTQAYNESRDLIRQLKQQDALWENEMLKARVALAHDYDPLVAPLKEMKRLWARFDSQEADQGRNDSGQWRDAHDGFLASLGEKARLVEQFKSHNALLRNSLAFLPAAEDSVQAQLGKVPDPDRKEVHDFATDTYDLLLSALEFAQVTSADKAAEIEVGLGALAVNVQNLPEEFQTPVRLLSSHVALILREQPIVNRLLEDIEAIPVAERLDSLTSLLDHDQQQVEKSDRRYHLYTLWLSGLLALSVVGLAMMLLRSFAEVRRVNSALQAANEVLEQRVEDRTRELRNAQSELFSAARQAGMAEIATNVLHNVGNVLNSVNTSCELIARILRSSKTTGLGRAVQLIDEHADDLGRFITEDPKGKLLPGYLNQVAEAITQEQRGIVVELERMNKSVDHIKEVVATQQSYAGAKSVPEPLSIHELIEDALRMNAGALTRHQVSVLRDFGDVPQVMGDRHRLLLILINLISNAKYAMSGLGNEHRTMTLKTRIIEGEFLEMSVLDEGEGIIPENLQKIFAHGFTTRKDGHGFGLHSCALAAIEMNGHLTAHSDGPGLGALFTLRIPLIAVTEPA